MTSGGLVGIEVQGPETERHYPCRVDSIHEALHDQVQRWRPNPCRNRNTPPSEDSVVPEQKRQRGLEWFRFELEVTFSRRTISGLIQ